MNQQYIISAAQNDEYRNEPPFKLQGSYRNMNKMAEKISAVMNQEELMQMIEDHYLGEAQLLTNGAEENLLKLAELRGNITEKEQQRWNEIKDEFLKNKMAGNEEATIGIQISDQLGEMVAGFQQVNESLKGDKTDKLSGQLEQITDAINGYKTLLEEPSANNTLLAESLGSLSEKQASNTEKLTTQISKANQSFLDLQEAMLAPKKTDVLLAKSLSSIAHKMENQAVAKQLERIVEGMVIMNRELEEVSDISQQKLKWLTRLRKRS